MLQVPLQFDDTSCSFSEQEWRSLDEGQKDLYRHIMKQNYQAVVSVGKAGLASGWACVSCTAGSPRASGQVAPC